jgi:hypothetical protein
MSKKLRNLALLGGLGAAAMMMGRKKDDEAGMSKEDMERDAREEAVSGPLKETKANKATKAMGRAMMKKDAAKDTADKAPSVRKPPTDSGSVRTPGRDMPSASALRPGAKAVAESSPGEFDRMMAERRAERERRQARDEGLGSMGDVVGAKKGGMIKSSASKRADGCATKGKTRGRMV